jgi:hypothetical protein
LIESAEIKQCPYCSEDILFTAKKCKHCNTLLIARETKVMLLNERQGMNAAKNEKPLQLMINQLQDDGYEIRDIKYVVNQGLDRFLITYW